ncbi:kinase domain protein (macronuclear) [Tetrahymena thermophila SB210]|uniref:Kinase domain protein n=1 Tax=Tetrahymena thermophila (strain SB210) TaxID=312017 RepID=I7ML61_TETTS|nr:kinase domain protein [Tetrahymena thermophila SB210]EAS01238.2 kinase domain protein [Tetrahymena thermophila SB210]|eukprot:XP_001021483.2 kinase domain protein [Tetrahymena thermophila SB210]
MRHQRFDSFINEQVSNTNNSTQRVNLSQTQNIQKRTKCYSNYENARQNQIIQNNIFQERGKDFLNKTFSIQHSAQLKNSNARQREEINYIQDSYQPAYQLDNINVTLGYQKQEYKAQNAFQQYSLKINGKEINDQQAKIRSKSHLGENDQAHNSSQNQNNHLKIPQLQPQIKKSPLEDTKQEIQSQKFDKPTDYLFKINVKTSEKQQLNKQQLSFSTGKQNSIFMQNGNSNSFEKNQNTLNQHRQIRSYSSNQKQYTNQSYLSNMEQKQSYLSISQFNDQPLNEPKIKPIIKNIQDFKNQNSLQIQNLNRKSNLTTRIASRMSNISYAYSSINSTNGKSSYMNKKRTITDQDQDDDDSVDDGVTGEKDEYSLLIKCEKKIKNSIKVLQRCIDQSQNVQNILNQNKEKYEREGNKEMLELLKNISNKQNNENDFSEELKQTNSVNYKQNQKQNKQLQIQISNQSEDFQQKNQNGTQDDQLQMDHMDLHSNKNIQNQQMVLKKQIQESLKKIEKYLDYSVQASKQSTIQMEQTAFLNEVNIQINEIYLKEESIVHKTINLFLFNKQTISVDLYYSNYETLPFDFKELESNKIHLLGQGTFGKVYKAKLLPKEQRYQHQSSSQHTKKRNNRDLLSLLKQQQDPIIEDEFYALKVIKCKNMNELEKKSQEIIIEYYLMQRQFRHSCNLILPVYYIQQNDQLDLLFLKQLADFNFTQLLNKRREKYLVYTEGELLQIFKMLLRIIKDMHDRNVAHRDIKPSNFVFFKKDRSWKLIDYGTAKIEMDLKQVKEYNFCGTRLYAIPKISQMKNFGELSSKVRMSLKAYDIYSLGITFIKIKKLLINPFDQKALKQILTSGTLDDETLLSNKIINQLINPNEEFRINLDLNDLIQEIEDKQHSKEDNIPNDYGVMFDHHSDFDYSKQKLEDEDQFERALTLKKINKTDGALSILFSLLDKDIQSKLKANVLNQIGQIYIIKGNYLQSLKYLEKSKELILQLYPKGSTKQGELFEDLGSVHFLLNKRDEGLDFFKKCYKIYKRNPLECSYKINKLKSKIQTYGIELAQINEIADKKYLKNQNEPQSRQSEKIENINYTKSRSIQFQI